MLRGAAGLRGAEELRGTGPHEATGAELGDRGELVVGRGQPERDLAEGGVGGHSRRDQGTHVLEPGRDGVGELLGVPGALGVEHGAVSDERPDGLLAL